MPLALLFAAFAPDADQLARENETGSGFYVTIVICVAVALTITFLAYRRAYPSDEGKHDAGPKPKGPDLPS